jgi:catechol 2,3-dioxygenase-like lactoylglutathione lyase family enzyme
LQVTANRKEEVMAVAELGVVVLDCPDPRALAEFYAGVLGGTVEGEGEWVDLKLPGGKALAFQAAPGFVPPKWPTPDHSQQFHLDLDVKDLDAAEKAVLELGAKPLDTEDRARTFRVYADPAGHPFCLCAC